MIQAACLLTRSYSYITNNACNMFRMILVVILACTGIIAITTLAEQTLLGLTSACSSHIPHK